MAKSFVEIIELAKTKKKKRICVACAQDEDVLKAVIEAKKQGLASSILVGDKEKMWSIANTLNEDISDFEIIKEKNQLKATKMAVEIVASQQADILMKGMVQTADLMRAALNRETGIRGSGLLSHVGVVEVGNYNRLIFITDGGLNIAPDMLKKADIIRNAVKAARAVGVQIPNVAVLSAIEVVNPDMPSTIDAAALSQMCRRGQIKDCVVDGPMALDNALSTIAAKHKGIDSPVAGETDIFIVPNIEAGNIFYKSLMYLANAKSCGIIMGANAPIVVTSRADTYETKLNSIAVAMLI